MAEAADLVARLRTLADGEGDEPWWWDSADRGGPAPLLREAADFIEHGSPAPEYMRSVFVDVLVYHYRRNDSSCGCGWAELGHSHPEHVADIYEESIRGLGTNVSETD